MDHLKEAKRDLEFAVNRAYTQEVLVLRAIAHALVALVEQQQFTNVPPGGPQKTRTLSAKERAAVEAAVAQAR